MSRLVAHYKEEAINKYLRLLFVPAVMLAFAALLVASRAWGHDGTFLACSQDLKAASITKLGEHINENGTISEAYDRNADGKLDLETISYVTATKQEDGAIVYAHVPYPVLYVVDLDYDGQPDKVYVDKNGRGKCEDIVEYEDLSHGYQKRENGQL